MRLYVRDPRENLACVGPSTRRNPSTPTSGSTSGSRTWRSPEDGAWHTGSIRSALGAGAAVLDGQGRVLLMWRHRFITDTWGYEIPIGGIKEGELPKDAAAREVEEETGWRPGPLRPLVYTQPSSGLSDSEHHIFVADSAEYIGEPEEDWEAERLDWVPVERVPDLVSKHELVSGTSMNALLYLYATGVGDR